MIADPIRCSWAQSDPLLMRYHDHEWGLPLHDETRLFEMFVLEGAQAGLSWLSILRKRPAYRKAFENFDPEKIARYGEAKVAELLSNAGIIRNRLKLPRGCRQRQGISASQRGIRQFRQIHLAIRGRQASPE